MAARAIEDYLRVWPQAMVLLIQSFDLPPGPPRDALLVKTIPAIASLLTTNTNDLTKEFAASLEPELLSLVLKDLKQQPNGQSAAVFCILSWALDAWLPWDPHAAEDDVEALRDLLHVVANHLPVEPDAKGSCPLVPVELLLNCLSAANIVSAPQELKMQLRGLLGLHPLDAILESPFASELSFPDLKALVRLKVANNSGHTDTRELEKSAEALDRYLTWSLQTPSWALSLVDFRDLVSLFQAEARPSHDDLYRAVAGMMRRCTELDAESLVKVVDPQKVSTCVLEEIVDSEFAPLELKFSVLLSKHKILMGASTKFEADMQDLQAKLTQAMVSRDKARKDLVREKEKREELERALQVQAAARDDLQKGLLAEVSARCQEIAALKVQVETLSMGHLNPKKTMPRAVQPQERGYPAATKGASCRVM